MLKRKTFPLLALLLAFSGALNAQPFVKLGLIEQPAGQIELRLLPNGGFSGVVSSTVITVRWATTPGISLDGDMAAYVNPAYNSSVGGLIYVGTATDEGFSYATWATFGNGPLGSTNAWQANVEIPFFRVPIVNTSGTCVDFEVIDDQFQAETNRLWYISLGGAERNDGFIPAKQIIEHHPAASCQNITVQLTPQGTAGILPDQISAGFLNCTGVALSLDQQEFNCDDLGTNTVTLTADADGVITTCNATVTVIDVDTDGDSVNDCNDACPEDPSKSISPGACGCGVVDVDTNNNGICDTDETTPDVRLGIVENTGGLLEFRLIPFEYFDGIVSSTVITVRWITTPGVTVIGENAAYINPAYNASIGGLNFAGITTDGIYSYATWATIGNAAIGTANAWQANTEVPLFTVPYTNTSASCVDLMVVNDTFQQENFIAWYISLAGEDHTDGFIPGEQIVSGFPDVSCQDVEVTLEGTGSISITPQEVNTSFLGCAGMALSLDQSTFDCNDLGDNSVTLTAIANGRTTTCSSTITVISPDPDGDGTNDCEDQCPLDPLKTVPGLCGCGETDIDTNNNGICDALEFPPNVKLGMIEQPAGSIEFVLLPDDAFNGIVSNTLVTVRWLTTPGVSVDGAAAAYVEPALAGPMGTLNYGGTSSDGIYSYATWATFGNSNIGTANAWSAGQEVPFFNVPIINTSGTCVEFELLYDQYQLDENIGWYISLSGEDKTDGFINGQQNITGYPDVTCQDISVTLDAANTASIVASDLNTSFNGCPAVDLSVSISQFDCDDLGSNSIILTADANGRITTCNSTVTVISLDDDGDGTVNCLDACPTDPLKTAPGICGCGEPDIDTNNNGLCDQFEVPPFVKLGIAEAQNAQLELILLPDDYFDGIVSNTLITVRWITTTGVTIDGENAAFVNSALIGAVGGLNFAGITTNGIYSYASWATFGNGNLGSANSWTAGIEVPFFRVPYSNTSGACVTFEVLTDQFQLENNQAWYISLSGQDRTDGYIAGKTAATGFSTPACEDISIFLDASGNASLDVAQLDPTSAAYCGVTSGILSATDFTCLDVGEVPVTLTLNHSNGHSSTCSSIVTVEDQIQPTVICNNISVGLDLDGSAGITPEMIDDGSYDNCGIAALTLDVSEFDCTMLGANAVMLTVTDVNGNVSSCNATVSVEDNMAPVPDLASLPDATGECSVSVIPPTATDNCSGTITGTTSDPVTYSTQGTYSITWSFDDGNGNTSTQLQTVVVDDVTAPVPDLASLPDDTGECSVSVTAPTATDNCSGTITGTTSDPVTYSTQGTYSITWSFDDGNGNTSTQLQTVVVDDVTAPEFTLCPGNISVMNDPGNCNGAMVFWSEPTVTDNCDPSVFVTMPAWSSGDQFPIGNTAISYLASDDQGNAATCSFSIEVQFLDADSDGICDEFDQCTGAEPGTPCDDGDPLTLNDVITSTCTCTGDLAYVDLASTVILDGPYTEDLDLMNDDLRAAGLIPLTHPFDAGPFYHTGDESILPAILSTTGPDAIVDWILVELRDGSDPQLIVKRRAALLQRDGNVVDLDGSSALRFDGVLPDAHFVVIRHRNHLGVMTEAPVALSSAVAMLDLTDPLQPNHGTSPADAANAQKSRNGRRMLWSGNVVTDGMLKYAGADNDRDPILNSIGGLIPTNTLTMVYRMEDVNMDGKVQYAGSGNDRDLILFNIGGEIPTAIRTEQLP